MSIDLQGSLADLARSVHDDGVADRMNGQVRTMVGRIRRRRAARYSATGVLGVGAVAAVAVGGLHLADRSPGPVPPAATSEPDAPSVGCGDPAPDVPAVDRSRDDLFLRGSIIPSVPYGEPVTVMLNWTNESPDTITYSRATIDIVVAENGVVVGTATDSLSLDVVRPTGSGAGLEDEFTILACAGDTPLDEGEYEVYAALTLDLAEGSRTLLAGPWLLTITDSPSDDVASAEAERAELESRLADIIAESERISAEYPFGVCGTLVPATPNDLLTLDLELDSSSYAAGDLIEGTAAISAYEGLTVLGNSAVTAAHVVVTRDGVVVGRGDYDPEHIALNTFRADEPYPLPALGNALLCSPPGAIPTELELPPGTYQAYATLDVALKEIQYPDGTAESRSDFIVVHSDPVNITID